MGIDRRSVPREVMATAILAASVGSGACAYQGAKADGPPRTLFCEEAPNQIRIPFSMVDGKMCPGMPTVAQGTICQAADGEPVLCVGRNAKIYWYAVDADDLTGGQINEKFALYFDPFVGNPYYAPNGCKTLQVDQKAPQGTDGVEYKYTIVRAEPGGAPDYDCQVIDPRIIVQP